MPLTTDEVYPQGSAADDDPFKYRSRRSVVHSLKGIVACTQPLAARCGIKILEAGGNAVVSFFYVFVPGQVEEKEKKAMAGSE